MSLIKDTTSLSFPTMCPGCSKKSVMDGDVFCTKCLINLPMTDLFTNPNMNKVVDNFRGRMPIEYGAAVFYFQSHGIVQELLHNFKYRQKKSIGTIIGNVAGEKMVESPYFNEVDVIVPVPLFWRKRKIRGYNQSTVFADGIGETSKLFVENALSKLYDSESQTSKTRMQRENNVKYHFAVNDHQAIKDKHVLLVDDVVTTGSTLAAAGNMLLKNGASKVSVITIAVAMY